ncbi:MAG: acetate--CoA ligase family protein [Anaerolineae bacterium]|nr:acetate--CoA ligase family protein [Anaerolineae bacterium]
MAGLLDLFFDPHGVAVIGASADPSKLSYGVVRNLRNGGYPRPIYPVNPRGGEILGLRVYQSILGVPDPVELAVIMIPAPLVPEALTQCGKRGLHAAIVITGGFREAGPEGAELELRLKQIAESYEMRLIGPNCVGVMDTHLPLDTTFITAMPSPGGIGFVSHSGAICGGTIDWARATGVGFSRIASLGNQLDVDIADGIAMMQDDPHTRVISVYAEGLPDGRRFVEAAARVYRRKPIVMLKAGLTTSGTRAVASHTGALAGNKQAYLAACHRAGVLVVHSLQEQNDIAIALATQPLPVGNRVAILTNAGGPAALAADELDRHGLAMADLTSGTLDQLATMTPKGAQLANPVDMLGGPAASMFESAGEVLLQDPGVDMLMAIFVPQAITPVPDVVASVVAAARRSTKPVVCCLVGGESITESIITLNQAGVPVYQDPNRASRALAGLHEYAQIRAREEPGPSPVDGANPRAVYEILRRRWNEFGAGFLDPVASGDVAAAYGIRTPGSGFAATADEAAALALTLGYPLAMKLVAPGVIHKADVGGVRLGLDSVSAVRSAYTQMVGDRSDWRVMLQEMAPRGYEAIVGVQSDPQFGPIVMAGLGGTLVEVLRDAAFRLAPLSSDDARGMVAETAAGRIIKGVRGNAPGDLTGLIDAIVRVGQLAHDFPCISELDINPLIVGEAGSGAWAVDVRIALDTEPREPADVSEAAQPR